MENTHFGNGRFYRRRLPYLATYCVLASSLVWQCFGICDVIPVYETHLTQLQGEVDSEINLSQKEVNLLLVKIQRAEMAPTRGPDSFLSTNNNDGRRRGLKGILNSALKMKIKELEHLKKQKNYLVGDQQIYRSLDEQPVGLVALNSNFRCLEFPLNQEDAQGHFEKVYSFGELLSPSLGKSSAKTQGVWWANTLGVLVKACAAGEVILSEFVEGRGFVIGLRHSGTAVTLYGNLDSSSVKSLKPGMRVSAGAPLGFALERFYFEARRGVEAVDPEQIFVAQSSQIQKSKDKNTIH